MFRRWLIRIPFLLVLTFVVGMWIGSYFGESFLYNATTSRFREGGAIQGLAFVGDSERDWFHKMDDLEFIFGVRASYDSPLHCPTKLGFYGGRWFMNDSFIIVFPLWLPTLLLLAVNWFVWRKTRLNSVTRGFPVEPASSTP